MRNFNRATGFLAAAVVAAVATVALLSVFASDKDTDPNGLVPRRTSLPTVAESSPSAEPEEPSARFATATEVNRQGGYAFAYPPRWKTSTEGTASTVTSPGDDVVITFGFGPSGGIESSSSELASLVRSSYEVLRLGSPRPSTVQGVDAVVVEGTAKNEDRVKVSFEVLTIDGPGEDTYAITVFSLPGASAEVLQSIEEILDSFAASTST